MASLNDVLVGEQQIAAAFATLKAAVETGNKDLAAVITTLQSQGVDTTTLQSILDTQASTLANIGTLGNEEAAADPGAQAAPAADTPAS